MGLKESDKRIKVEEVVLHFYFEGSVVVDGELKRATYANLASVADVSADTVKRIIYKYKRENV